MASKKLISTIAIAFITLISAAFSQPFANDIAAFKKSDSISKPFPGIHPILFVGSSSFTKWKDVQQYFPGYPILNRGFGGSTIPDVIRYKNDIIFPYMPKQIVIYCGENDLASSDDVTAKTVTKRFKELYSMIKKELPYANIVFVSLKPSPSREKLWPKMVAANASIKRFLKRKSNTSFVDVYSKMFNSDGTVMADIFVEDRLHMNAKGYAIWQKAIEPYLLK